MNIKIKMVFIATSSSLFSNVTIQYVLQQLCIGIIVLRDPQIKAQQEAYLKHKFLFMGVKKPQVLALVKQILKTYPLGMNQRLVLCHMLYQLPYRECHYMALYLLENYKASLTDIALCNLESFLQFHQWWDTIDQLASNVIGPYFSTLEHLKKTEYLRKWQYSDNIWLNRVCIIFQLRYKLNTDTIYLAYICDYYKNHQDFFIKKAIGWALREYAKVDANWVLDFVARTKLSPLSRQQALLKLNHTHVRVIKNG